VSFLVLFLSVRFVVVLRFSQRWLWRIPSSGMWRSVDLVWTDVSEERIASLTVRSMHRWTGHRDWGSSQQYEQRGWFLSQLPQENSRIWRQIYKAMQVNTRSAALAPRLLSQCVLGSPVFSPPPTTFLYLLWSPLCYLLAWPSWSLLTLTLFSIAFPCFPLSLPPTVYI
jgi:hypothetical protein